MCVECLFVRHCTPAAAPQAAPARPPAARTPAVAAARRASRSASNLFTAFALNKLLPSQNREPGKVIHTGRCQGRGHVLCVCVCARARACVRVYETRLSARSVAALSNLPLSHSLYRCEGLGPTVKGRFDGRVLARPKAGRFADECVHALNPKP